MPKDEGDDNNDVVAQGQQHRCRHCRHVVGCVRMRVRMRTKARVCEDEDKDEVHFQTHKDMGEGKGGQWCAMVRVTVIVMLLDTQG